MAAQLPRDVGPVHLAVGGAVIVTAWLLATLAFQAARLWTRDRGAPLFIGLVALVGVWFGPFVGSIGLRELGVSPTTADLPRLVNPFYALTYVGHTGRIGAFDPLALAITCATLHAFVALGVAWLVHSGARRVAELADSLVVLPADADDAPGTLERRCPNGHVYGGMWSTCPHCPGAVSSAQQTG
jgi:hypothetical protein